MREGEKGSSEGVYQVPRQQGTQGGGLGWVVQQGLILRYLYVTMTRGVQPDLIPSGGCEVAVGTGGCAQ